MYNLLLSIKKSYNLSYINVCKRINHLVKTKADCDDLQKVSSEVGKRGNHVEVNVN